jgi:predicted DNA-binding mobile mystery protein A
MKPAVRSVILKGLDTQIDALRNAQTALRHPPHGWLRAVRESVGLSQAAVAKNLGITQQAYADIEKAEKRGTITLQTLRRAAEAMDCGLTYFTIPRLPAARTFEDLALRLDPKRRHLADTEHSMSLEGQAVGDLKPRKSTPP